MRRSVSVRHDVLKRLSRQVAGQVVPEMPKLAEAGRTFTHMALIDAVGRVINLDSSGRRQSALSAQPTEVGRQIAPAHGARPTDRAGAEAPRRYLGSPGRVRAEAEHPGATVIRLA